MNEQEIFAAALEHDSTRRAAFLDEACGTDAHLRHRVENLLQLHEQAGEFFEKPAAEIVATVNYAEIPEGPGTHIGPYKLLEQIGEGGFGVVFMAEQHTPVRRKVALKIIKPGMDTRQIIVRFEAERQALALMDHPNIAKVFDAGTTDSGRPYFVMELVRGIPITDFCDQHQLTVGERLELFITVCHAAQHAHQKGIIHRDIKPTNVLVTLHDDRPVVKVIDFGVAKATSGNLTDQTLFTGFMQMLGTPLYMSPEQTALSSIDVDTRSDIYSLGVLVYELLTGTTPFDRQRFDRAALDEVGRIIREEEPRKPSTRLSTIGDTLPSVCARRKIEPRKLTQLLSGDLDWIVMKALEKDRTRRYETANGFARDIQRYLADELVEARPPSAGYRLQKAIRRNKVALTTATVVAIALLGGTIISTWQWILARDARELAEQRLKAEEKAHDEANQARKSEAEQRLQAEANLRKAREAVDKYFTTVSESKLLNVPGMVPLRKELLRSALEYYQGFSEQETDNPTTLADLAVAELRVVQIMYWNGDREDHTLAQLEKGVEILERLVRDGRDSPDVQRRVAGFLQSNPEPRLRDVDGRVDNDLVHEVLLRATKLWEKFAHDNPNFADFRSDLASLNHLMAINRRARPNDVDHYTERARILWEKLVEEFPAEPRYRLELGRLYVDMAAIESGDVAKQSARKAREIFEELVAQFPHVPTYRIWLGMSFQSEGKVAVSEVEAESAFAKAVDQFQKVVAEFPTAVLCRKELALSSLQLADTLTKRGKDVEAIEHYRQSVNTFEALVAESANFGKETTFLMEARFRLSARLVAAGRQQEADEISRKARESMPNNAGRLNGIAWRLVNSQSVQVQDAKWAVELAQRAVELEPQAGYIWNTLGVACYRAGDWKASIAALEKSMEHGDNCVDWFFIAMARWQLAEKDVAKKWYRAADLWVATRFPNFDEYKRYRAEAAALMGLTETASAEKTDYIALGALLVELHPQPWAYICRGEAFANSEQWKQALDDFTKATELGDKGFSSWYMRTLILCAMGDTPGYRAACSEMLKQFPFAEEPDTAHFVAWTCALGSDALPEFALAVASAGRAAKKDAKSATYAGGLGAILYRAGRFDEARQKLEEADRLSSADSISSSPAYNWFFLAMTHQRLGNAEEAKQWFDKSRDATQKALNEHDAGTQKLPWNRRLTLKLLRREAEALLGFKSAPGESAAIIPAYEEAPVEAKKPRADSIDKLSTRN